MEGKFAKIFLYLIISVENVNDSEWFGQPDAAGARSTETIPLGLSAGKNDSPWRR
jgi:hypothetical protein